jgi:5-methylcytosine-specific restriction endonuclease McrA
VAVPEPARDCPLVAWHGDPARCRWCDDPLPKHARRWCTRDCEDAFWSNHAWDLARGAALRRDARRCVLCGHPSREVDHIEPRRGATRRAGCWHHVDNLRVLCHRHHVVVTTAQRARRRAGLNDVIATDEIAALAGDDQLELVQEVRHA